ncbi:MAG: hypothetical protein OXC53_08705 [Rhodobacteraceae bacterium]|nr:hypothetical protein [Gammaproteobacteria bacterium]MCY4327650.1 hypothetical protein [Paracoccaceae bacterium]
MAIRLEEVREKAARAITPLKPADRNITASEHLLFSTKRINTGIQLPEPYLVYFLLADLLEFWDMGRWEKQAYAFPVDFNGTVYLIEHRKFGLGVFAADQERQQDDATEIVRLVRNGVTAAQPFFEHLANEAAQGSNLSVANYSRTLFEKFEYLRRLYLNKSSEVEMRQGECTMEETKDESKGITTTKIRFPSLELDREARWLGTSAVDAFFSWTEHVFIHIAILNGVCSTGEEVGRLARANWGEKFKAALPIDDHETKKLYDELITIRRRLRNHVAHGAFGKDGEAFSFHSTAGAVPLILPHTQNSDSFRFGSGADLNPKQAFDSITHFESHIWSAKRAGIKLYIQDLGLPAILTMAADGTYEGVRETVEDMVEFTEHLMREMDNAANMDW